MKSINIWIKRNYGRRQGLLRHAGCLVRRLLGFYRPFARVDWGRVERVVFVCQGNICRSPYAEARGREVGLPASSFGLGAGVGGRRRAASTARQSARRQPRRIRRLPQP